MSSRATRRVVSQLNGQRPILLYMRAPHGVPPRPTPYKGACCLTAERVPPSTGWAQSPVLPTGCGPCLSGPLLSVQGVTCASRAFLSPPSTRTAAGVGAGGEGRAGPGLVKVAVASGLVVCSLSPVLSDTQP